MARQGSSTMSCLWVVGFLGYLYAVYSPNSVKCESAIWSSTGTSFPLYSLSSVVKEVNKDFPQCECDDDGQEWPPSIVSVDSYGAVGNGITDDSEAFKRAWKRACKLDSAILLIPGGRTYLVGPLNFKGPCGNNLVVELAGSLVAPFDPHAWSRPSSNAWIHFRHMNDLVLQGWGKIDGRGNQWWDGSCKRNSSVCFDAPTALRFTAVHNLRVRNLNVLNSPQIHVKFANCYGVHVSNLRVDAPSDSPNTDGLHISASQNVLVQDSSISTGDDCVSIVSGSSDIKIKNIACGPGHGISIGSLGHTGNEEHVSLVVVDGAILTGTLFGLRIKTWQGGMGSAVNIRFQNVEMVNVSHPIVIDQSYCDTSASCPVNETSAVQVSKVCYNNIWGTSSTKEAIKLTCSSLAPCKHLHFENVNLMPITGIRDVFSSCQSANGFIRGSVVPFVDCLQLLPQAPVKLHNVI